MAGAIATAIGDCIITFLWMMVVSTFGPLTAIISDKLEIKSLYMDMGITVVLITLLILLFDPISRLLGNASFNPANNAAFYAAGIGDDTLFGMALRFPAQALGAVGGALAIMEVMPYPYKSMLAGPSLKVDSHTGAMAEGILTFFITLPVLWIIVKGPTNNFIKAVMLASTTVVFIVLGSTYTGPSMNPINAYGWAYIYNSHNTWEQFYVYWIPTFCGAILAGWIFKFISSPSSTKKAKRVKKAKAKKA